MQVTVISRGRPEDLPELLGTCTFRHVDGSTTTAASYAAADLATADAVIVGTNMPCTSESPTQGGAGMLHLARNWAWPAWPASRQCVVRHVSTNMPCMSESSTPGGVDAACGLRLCIAGKWAVCPEIPLL